MCSTHKENHFHQSFSKSQAIRCPSTFLLKNLHPSPVSNYGVSPTVVIFKNIHVMSRNILAQYGTQMLLLVSFEPSSIQVKLVAVQKDWHQQAALILQVGN